MSRISVSRKRLNYLLLFTMIVLIVACMIIGSRRHMKFDAFVMLTFGMNICISILGLINAVSKYYFSLDFIFWLFNLFFLSVTPTLQYATNTFSWNMQPTYQEVIRTNLYISLWFLAYMVGHAFEFGIKKRSKKAMAYPQSYFPQIQKNRIYVLAVISGLITLYYVLTVGISGLIFRMNNTSTISLNKTMSLLVDHGFRDFSAFSAAIALVDILRRKRVLPCHVILMVFFLVACFPTGIARNMMATMYGGMLIIVVKNKRIEKWMTLLVLFGLVLVFPGIEIFRSITSLKGINVFETVSRSISNTYLESHYDAYQMFIFIQRFVDKVGLSYGYRFLGALLFFVPRSIWPSKPVGTGQAAFEALKQHEFTNVSAPFISEVYVNFGILGIVIVGFLLGNCIRQLDKAYWREAGFHRLISFIYPFVLYTFFFMLRGDLLTSYAYGFAQVVVGSFVYLFATDRMRCGLR